MEYYVVIDGKQAGPFGENELRGLGLAQDTPVWREGMEEWQPASALPELSFLFEAEPAADNSSKLYYAMVGDTRIGPMPVDSLLACGCMQPDTLVWCEGMLKWQKASENADFAPRMQCGPVPPGYDAPRYEYQNTNPQPPLLQPAWMSWAIVATVVNFITLWFANIAIAGLVLGVLGIYYSNETKKRLALGMTQPARQSENNARIMTIISLAIGGIAILLSILAVLALVSIFSSIPSFIEIRNSLDSI